MHDPSDSPVCEGCTTGNRDLMYVLDKDIAHCLTLKTINIS